MKNTKITLRDAAKTYKRALKIIYKKSSQTVVSCLIYAAWQALAPYIVIYFSARIIEKLSESIAAGLSASEIYDAMLPIVLITLGVTAATALVTALLTRWRNPLSDTMYYKIQSILSDKMLTMDFATEDDTKTHELLSKIEQNQNGGWWGLVSVIDDCEKLISAVVSIAFGIVLTASMFTSMVPQTADDLTVLNNPFLIAGIIALMLAATMVSPMLAVKGDSYWAKNADAHAFGNREFGFFGFLAYDNDLAADMRIYRQDIICSRHNSNKHSTFCSKGPFAKYARGPMGMLKIASAAVGCLFMGVAYVFVCLKAWAGAFGVGMVTQYVASLTKVSGGLSSLLITLGRIKYNAFFIKDAFELLDLPNTMTQGALTVPKSTDENYQVEFRDVSYRYPAAAGWALRHVNIKFGTGEKLAVVGVNGSGKTTFIKLLCRLYDPTEGQILLNGVDIKNYNYRDYLNIFSVVFQDFQLFALPLGQNVAGSARVDTARAEKALNDAGFSDRLLAFPKGLDTYLYKNCEKDGVEISGGEAQKIAIARALYKNSPFVVLDEPTAALDPVAEAEIYEKFSGLVSAKTAIYISHRLSSCKFCDEIAVFDGGNIVQHGSHEGLLAETTGKYFELWHAQAKYYEK